MAKALEHLQGAQAGLEELGLILVSQYRGPKPDGGLEGLGFGRALATSSPWLLLNACERRCRGLQLEWKLERPKHVPAMSWSGKTLRNRQASERGTAGVRGLIGELGTRSAP